jgi:ornithine cyclodeaminase/alanine dehydrogenase-like protein (mu-crystallin family)
MADAMTSVTGALGGYERGESIMPPKVYLEGGGSSGFLGDFRAMPALLSPHLAGIKWINSHPHNPTTHGLPSVRGTLMLSCPQTARLLAVMDATYITAMRTGAAAGVATATCALGESTGTATSVAALGRCKEASREGVAPLAGSPGDYRIAGFVGLGVQAPFALEAVVLAMRGLSDQPIALAVYDASEAAVAAFVATVPADIAVFVAPDAATVAEASDVLTTCTPSRTPVIPSGTVLKKGAVVNAIGADAEGKQEFASDLTKGCRILLDDRAQAFHSGEVNVPLATGHITEADVAGTLGQVIAGGIAARESPDDIVMFDSTGLALQDLAVAAAVLTKAEEMDVGVCIDLGE